MPSKKITYLLVFVGVFLAIVFIYSPVRELQGPLTAEDYAPETYSVMEQSEGVIDSFPDLPIYENSSITESKYYSEEGGEGFYLEFTTNDPVMSIIDWYRLRLNEDGWVSIYQTEDLGNLEPEYFTIEYKKPDIQLDVSAVKQGDGSTRVIITHHEHMGEYGPIVKYE